MLQRPIGPPMLTWPAEFLRGGACARADSGDSRAASVRRGRTSRGGGPASSRPPRLATSPGGSEARLAFVVQSDPDRRRRGGRTLAVVRPDRGDRSVLEAWGRPIPGRRGHASPPPRGPWRAPGRSGGWDGLHGRRRESGGVARCPSHPRAPRLPRPAGALSLGSHDLDQVSALREAGVASSYAAALATEPALALTHICPCGGSRVGRERPHGHFCTVAAAPSRGLSGKVPTPGGDALGGDSLSGKPFMGHSQLGAEQDRPARLRKRRQREASRNRVRVLCSAASFPTGKCDQRRAEAADAIQRCPKPGPGFALLPSPLESQWVRAAHVDQGLVGNIHDNLEPVLPPRRTYGSKHLANPLSR